MKEDWKDIKGYETLYQISNFGRVKMIHRNNLIKKTTKVPKGYIRIGLTKNGITKYFYIHRLVAETFIPNIENKPCINHKDHNVKNNNVNNLEWVTYKENNHQRRPATGSNTRDLTIAIETIKKNLPSEIKIIKQLTEIKKKYNQKKDYSQW